MKQIIHYIECFRVKIHDGLEQPITPVRLLQKRNGLHQSILVLTCKFHTLAAYKAEEQRA